MSVSWAVGFTCVVCVLEVCVSFVSVWVSTFACLGVFLHGSALICVCLSMSVRVHVRVCVRI